MEDKAISSILEEQGLKKDDVNNIGKHYKEGYLSLKEEDYIIQMLKTPFKEIKPKCKHKYHQYTEIRKQEGSIIYSEWICECGKRL